MVGGINGAAKRMMTGLNHLLNAGFKSPRLAVDSLISEENYKEVVMTIPKVNTHDKAGNRMLEDFKFTFHVDTKKPDVINVQILEARPGNWTKG